MAKNFDGDVSVEALVDTIFVDPFTRRLRTEPRVWLQRKRLDGMSASEQWWVIVPFNRLLLHSQIMFGQDIHIQAATRPTQATSATDYQTGVTLRDKMLAAVRSDLTRFAKRNMRGTDATDFSQSLELFLAGDITEAEFLRAQPRKFRGELGAITNQLTPPAARLRESLFADDVVGVSYQLQPEVEVAKPQAAVQELQIHHDDEATIDAELTRYRGLDAAYHHGQPWTPVAVLIGQ